jgi:hypothetical protein
MNGNKVCLAPVSRLSPIERHGTKRKEWLARKIQNEGVWKVPLRVERSRMLVMDGHHRLEVARLLNLQQVPVLYYLYDDVTVYSLRKNVDVTPAIIMDNADKGLIFPYKTAKHVFPDDATEFHGIPLDELR